MASSSTPSASSISAQKHHVFLSFRGEDTRNIFVGHLYKGLDQAGVRTFRDKEKLEKGDLISPQLLQAIEESSVSIVILSENYANSSWCIDELGKIIECRDKREQKVYPVFYNVEPSDVRKQQGNFGKGFNSLSSRFQQEPEKTKKWKLALEEVCRAGGFHLNKAENKCEAEFIEEIINEVCKTVSKIDLGDLPGLVGVESRAEKVIKLLDLQSNDIHVVGIWGMGGVGKTTIAEFVYNQISWQFKDSCYLENVKGVWREKGAKALQQQLIGNLSAGKGIYFSRSSDGLRTIKNMICYRKILIVLDDVDHSVKIEKLIGNPEYFGKGSKIIITTRDKDLLTQYDAKQYEVELLSTVEALQLFSLKAFGKNQQIGGFKELVSQAIAYAGGLPLALEVLGSSLRGKEESVWKSTLDRLKQYPEEEVQSILKISYDALQETEKQIFLDIACCLKDGDKDRIAKILDNCGFYASSGISVLEDKSLVRISHGKICMHQLIQEMGWNIVRKESKNLAKRTRLWNLEDLRCLLIENKGTKATESIAVEVKEGETLQLGAEAFSGMTRLRLLKIGTSQNGNVQFAKEFEYLPSTLRYLDLDKYPFKQLPSMFQLTCLVELNMRQSNLERLWEQTVNVHLPMLRLMDLCGSRRLTKCPDFTTTPNLERLHLHFCTSLGDIHPSIGVLRKLIHLHFTGCKKLTSFPEIFENMKCLEYLRLDGTNITEIPKSFGHLTSLKMLNLQGCSKVTSIPNCFENMKCLEYLILDGTNITEIPISFGHLTSLTNLSLDGCSKVTGIPDCFENMKCLQYLRLDGTNITKIPRSFGHLKSLTNLSLDGLSKVTSIPDCFENMKYLMELSLRLIGIEELPTWIFHLTDLIVLRLDGCKNLRRLPKGIGALKYLKLITLSDCVKLDKLPEDLDDMGSSVNFYVDGTAIREVPLSAYLKQNGRVSLSGCKYIKPDLFGSSFRRYSFCSPGEKRCDITKLSLDGCHLRWIPPEICLLHSLESLDLCLNDFEYLPASMVQLSKFRALYLNDCSRLQQLPELSSSLRILVADNCKSLREICNPLVYTRIEHFLFLNCFQLVENIVLRERVFLNSFRVSNHLLRDLDNFRCTTPGCEIPKWFGHQNRMGSSISFQFPLDCRNDNLLGLLVCSVFEAASEDFHFTIVIKGWSVIRFHGFYGCRDKRRNSKKFRTRGDNVWLWAMKYCADLTFWRKIKIIFTDLKNIKVKKCGAHLLYKDDPIFSSIESNDQARNKNNKKRPSSGNCDKNFSTRQIMLDQHFNDNNTVDKRTGARTHPVGDSLIGLTNLEHTKYRGGKERYCEDQLDINHNKDLCDHCGNANFEEEQNIKRPRLLHETFELDIDLHKNAGDHSESANFVEEQSTKKLRLSHETLELDMDLNKDAGDHSGSANFEEEQSTKMPRLSHETLDLDRTPSDYDICPIM